VLLAGLAAWTTAAGVRRLMRAGSMRGWTSLRKQQIASFAAIVAFLAVLISTPWIVHLASLLIFKLDPGAAPGTFAVVYRAVNDRYAVTGWPVYPRQGAGNGFKTFRLPDAGGFIDGPKLRYSFRVLEDDGARQIVEVRTEGVIHAVSRYAVHAERIEPLSYRGRSWGFDQGAFLPPSLIGIALAIAAAWSMFAAAARFTRLQQT
jgi:hypothetical protein